MSDDDNLTPSEQEALKLIQGYGSPIPEEKHNIHTFLSTVVKAEDTTKLGFLKEEEIGLPKLPVRALKDLALFADKVMDNPFFKEYFLLESEIVTAPSLSREGFLIKQATLQKRVIEDATRKTMKQNKGWFQKKKKDEGDLDVT